MKKTSGKSSTNGKLGSITSEQLERESAEMQLKLKSIQDKVYEHQLNGLIKPSSGSSNLRSNNSSSSTTGKNKIIDFLLYILYISELLLHSKLRHIHEYYYTHTHTREYLTVFQTLSRHL